LQQFNIFHITLIAVGFSRYYEMSSDKYSIGICQGNAARNYSQGSEARIQGRFSAAFPSASLNLNSSPATDASN